TAKPTMTAAPTATAAPSTSAKPTATATPAASAKPTATAAPTATAKPTVAPTAKPTATAKPTVAPTAKPTEKPNYAEINKEMIANLTAVSNDIYNKTHDSEGYEVDIFTGKGKTLIAKIKTCIDKAIIAGDSNIIDSDFVRTTYKSEINEAKKLYNQIMSDDKAKASFQNGLAYLETDTIIWLANEFGIIDY
ncbi:MAG: hypothetical protein IJO50_02560, partial [Clostridia bacterium]|nr:hypothetical protein [Clostridia bacterium]